MMRKALGVMVVVGLVGGLAGCAGADPQAEGCAELPEHLDPITMLMQAARGAGSLEAMKAYGPEIAERVEGLAEFGEEYGGGLGERVDVAVGELRDFAEGMSAGSISEAKVASLTGALVEVAAYCDGL